MNSLDRNYGDSTVVYPLLKNINAIRDQYGLNLDRFYDIQALLGTFVTTQTRNAYQTKGGVIGDRIKLFPSLFSCNDPSNYNEVLKLELRTE